jgi:hypothetical protein
MVSTSVRSQIAPHVHLISVAIEPNMRPSAAAIKAKSSSPIMVLRMIPNLSRDLALHRQLSPDTSAACRKRPSLSRRSRRRTDTQIGELWILIDTI